MDFKNKRRLNNRLLIPTVTLIALLLYPITSQSEELTQAIVGSVKTAIGTTYIYRGEHKIPAVSGSHLYQGDTLVTESGSSMGVIFRDDTLLSLGSKSKVHIDNFIFKPVENAMEFLVRISNGTAQVITGQMANISPESMKVQTPLSTIGIRGTRFLVKVD